MHCHRKGIALCRTFLRKIGMPFFMLLYLEANFYALKSRINKLPSTIKFFRGMAVVYDPDCVYVRALKLFLSDEPDSYERLRNLTFSLLEKEGFDCGDHVEGKLHKVRESIKKYHRLFVHFRQKA